MPAKRTLLRSETEQDHVPFENFCGFNILKILTERTFERIIACNNPVNRL